MIKISSPGSKKKNKLLDFEEREQVQQSKIINDPFSNLTLMLSVFMVG